MKQLFLKITTVLLTLLVLFSTFSFTVESHYCGDFLMDVSFTGNAADCGMQMEQTAVKKKKNCCKDELQKIEGQDELQYASTDDFDLLKQQFLTSFLVSYNDLFLPKETKKSVYTELHPPEIPKNYQVLFQVFLI